MENKTITIYCAKCQAETAHSGSVDFNGEIVLTCTSCEGFVKLPAGMSTDEYKTLLAEHKEVNEGQVSLQTSIDALDALFTAEEDPAEEDPTV